MKKLLVILCTILIWGTSLQLAFGAAPTWNLDKGHSGIYFRIDHIFSKTQGRFDDFSTNFQFDPKNLAESSIELTIATKSIDTGIGQRDKHLRSADFFDAKKFPTITFSSTKISKRSDNTFEVAGKLTVKGKSFDFVLPLELVGVKQHPREKGKLVAGFNGEVVLDRLQYGIGSGKFVEKGLIGKDVEVLVTLELLQ